MTVDQAVLVVAGSLVLLSVALAYFVALPWLLLAVFVGANAIQSAFTGFCPAAMLFKKLGFKSGPAF